MNRFAVRAALPATLLFLLSPCTAAWAAAPEPVLRTAFVHLFEWKWPDIARRPQSVAEVLEALLESPAVPAASPPRAHRAVGPETVSTASAPSPGSVVASGSSSRRRGVVVAAVVALLLLGGLGYLWVQNQASQSPVAQPSGIPGTPTVAQRDVLPDTAPAQPVAAKVPEPAEPAVPPPPLVGHVQVNVNVTDAVIQLDGTEIGQASPGQALNLRDLPLGVQRLTVSAPGYQPQEQAIEIKANAWTQVAIRLQPEIVTGELIVRSNVSGDTVSVDGAPVGSTGPQAHAVLAGTHRIRVEKVGISRTRRRSRSAPGIAAQCGCNCRPTGYPLSPSWCRSPAAVSGWGI